MEVTLKVKRFNPESESKEPYFQEYNLEVEDYVTVLDALIKVREEVDGSLALRCSCRAAICGSCSMRVNGHAKLACNTKIVDVAPKDHNVTVEPMGNLPVVKDLVTDMKPFWDRVRAVQPWLQPQGPEPEEEYIAPGEDMLHLTGVMSCIMCGACASDCTVLEVDRNFLGPAALAKGVSLRRRPQRRRRQGAAGQIQPVRRNLGLHSLHGVRTGMPQGRRAYGAHNVASGTRQWRPDSPTTTERATRTPSQTW